MREEGQKKGKERERGNGGKYFERKRRNMREGKGGGRK